MEIEVFHPVSQLRLKLAELSWYFFQQLFWPQICLFSVWIYTLLSILHTSLCSSPLYWQLLLTNTVWMHTTKLVVNVWHMDPCTVVRWVFFGNCTSDLEQVRQQGGAILPEPWFFCLTARKPYPKWMIRLGRHLPWYKLQLFWAVYLQEMGAQLKALSFTSIPGI